MALLATYTQQPADRLDYDIPYDLADGDSILTVTVAVTPSGLIVNEYSSVDTVKLWVESGVTGATYKVEVTTTTTLGRIKQDEIKFKIKDK
jgi:hypothetical protein